MTTAENSAGELKRAANEYVDDAMRRTEEALGAALEEMRQTRARFRSAAGTNARAQRSGRDYDTGRIDISLE
jgi:hypothetical protein